MLAYGIILPIGRCWPMVLYYLVAMLAYGIILPVGRCWPMILYYLLVDVGLWYYITCW